MLACRSSGFVNALAQGPLHQQMHMVAIRAMSTSRVKANFNRRVFNDRARIQVRGGDGGNGCASFARTLSGVGGPNGGNGGRGGNVYLKTDSALTTFDFAKYHFNGGKGHKGGSDGLHGSYGNEVVVNIPPGTVVKEILAKDPVTGQVETRLIADMSEPDMKLLVAEGAKGGYGNRTFKSADNPKAGFTTMGEFGKSMRLQLELKVIADVGLVGYPNAGKSSLLNAVSKAAPKIASYAFTTLHPTVAVVDLPDDMEEACFTMADLPGLVDGAHRNVGLGHEFLRHVERTKVLLYVVDLARPLAQMRTMQEMREQHLLEEEVRKREWIERKQQEDQRLAAREAEREAKLLQKLILRGVPKNERHLYTYEDEFPHDTEEKLLVAGGTQRIYEGEYVSRPRKVQVTDLGDPVAEFLSLRRELALYQPELAARPAIVLANKFDIKPAACAAQLERLRKVVPPHWPLFTGSAKQNQGLEPLLHTIKQMLRFVNNENDKNMEKIDLDD